MLKKYSTRIIGFITTNLIFLMAALPASAQWTGVCVDDIHTDVATIQGFQCLLARLLSNFLTFVGIVGFLMLVVSGIRIMLSGGNSQAVEKSKSSVTFAIVGLVVALSSFIILNLIAEFTGVQSILQFSIPTADTNW
jgi:hypothetical protein